MPLAQQLPLLRCKGLAMPSAVEPTCRLSSLALPGPLEFCSISMVSLKTACMLVSSKQAALEGLDSSSAAARTCRVGGQLHLARTAPAVPRESPGPTHTH